MPVCSRCNNDVGLLGRLSFNSQTGRCANCEKQVRRALDDFRRSFLNASGSRLVSEDDWQGLIRQAQVDGLNMNEALAYILGDSLHFLERALTFFYADENLAPDEEQYLRTMIGVLAIPPQHAGPIIARINYLKSLTRIRAGHLPAVSPSIHLEADEICHMEMEAAYNKVNAKSVTRVPGRFIATNKRLHFLSASGGAEILWKRVMRVEKRYGAVYLELSTKKGNGLYQVSDADWAEAVIDTLARMAKRQLLAPQEEASSRHIPQNVKQSVWQRDQGKCVQCGATSYLEFDHIIPFSKGGASSVNNVQLLCRKCNLSKGGRL